MPTKQPSTTSEGSSKLRIGATRKKSSLPNRATTPDECDMDYVVASLTTRGRHPWPGAESLCRPTHLGVYRHFQHVPERVNCAHHL